MLRAAFIVASLYLMVSSADAQIQKRVCIGEKGCPYFNGGVWVGCADINQLAPLLCTWLQNGQATVFPFHIYRIHGPDRGGSCGLAVYDVVCSSK